MASAIISPNIMVYAAFFFLSFTLSIILFGLVLFLAWLIYILRKYVIQKKDFDALKSRKFIKENGGKIAVFSALNAVSVSALIIWSFSKFQMYGGAAEGTPAINILWIAISTIFWTIVMLADFSKRVKAEKPLD